MNEFIPLFAIVGFSFILMTLFFGVFKLDQKDWRTKLYPLGMAVLGGLGGLWLHFGGRSNPLNLPNIYISVQLICLGLGLIHLWWMYQKLFWSKRNGYDTAEDSFLPEFVYTLLVFCFITVGVMGAICYLGGACKMGLYWNIALLFIVPFLFVKCFDVLNQIPQRDFSQKWTFSDHRIGEDNWQWENEIWVSFLVKEHLEGALLKIGRYASFRVSAPRKVPLGEMYRLAIREYNRKGPEVIVQDLGFERENLEKFWWLFSIKIIWNQPSTWFRKIRYLDPFISPVKNKIRPHDIILARRISTVGASKQIEEYAFDEDIAMGEI